MGCGPRGVSSRVGPIVPGTKPQPTYILVNSESDVILMAYNLQIALLLYTENVIGYSQLLQTYVNENSHVYNINI